MGTTTTRTPGGTWRPARSGQQSRRGLQPGRARQARLDRAAAIGSADTGPASAPRLPATTATAQRPGQERLPRAAARPQRDPVLPGTVRPPRRAAAGRLRPDRRRRDREVLPRVPAAARHLPVHRPAGRDRQGVRHAGARPGRRRPDRLHRRRGDPRHRRLGSGRHPDRGRQAGRLHRRGGHRPAPGHPGVAGRRHRQRRAAQRPAIPGQPARPGPRRRLRRVHRQVPGDGIRRCSRTRCCTSRTSARATPGGSWCTYRDKYRIFNDDMQGTGAIILAAALSARQGHRRPDAGQRLVVSGAGTAGVGIADQLRDAMVRDGADREQATAQVWLVDKQGLLTERHGRPAGLPAAPTPAPGRRSPAGLAAAGRSRCSMPSGTSSRPSCSAPPRRTGPSPRRSSRP